MKLRFDIKPITINQAYTGRRFKTDLYKQFSKDIRNLLLLQKKNIEKINGFLTVECRWFLKNWQKFDIDNPTKILLDILTQNEIFKDDKYIMKLIAEKIPSRENYIKIEIDSYKGYENCL